MSRYLGLSISVVGRRIPALLPLQQGIAAAVGLAHRVTRKT